MALANRLTFLHSLIALLAVLALILPTASAVTLTAEEQAIFNSMRNASGQQRASLTVDDILTQVARAHARDMAQNDYFGHAFSDGHQPNWHVEAAGYRLPDSYPNDGNNIESIAAGQTSAGSAWSAWMNSASHKQHLLAEHAFYATQTRVGIGYYRDPSSEYIHYWVVLTAPPQPGPQLSITSPDAGERVTSPQVAVSGTAGGTTPVTSVQFRVENATGTGSYQTASGTATWSGTATNLVPGSNTIRVRSLDSGGSVLKEATVSITYAVIRPLNVSVNGEGSVSSGYLGTSQREVGRTYTVTATPATGWVFNGWTGSITSSSTALSFTMSEGLSLVANFVPNPFVGRNGLYNGLIQSGSPSHASSGFVSVKMTTSGGFSGKLTLGGVVYSVKGKFDAAGDTIATIARKNQAPLTLTLHVDLAGDTGRMTGSVTDGTLTASVTADRARTSAEGPSPFAGRYTLSLPGSSSGALPRGHGFGTMVVDSAGIAKMSGSLADGRSFSQSAAISKNGVLPIYAALYSGTGSLAGNVTCRETGASDVDGSVRWTKPERLTDRYQQAAINHSISLIGSRYVAPAKGTTVLDVVAGPNNSELEFTAGNLDSQLAQTATLDASNRVVISARVIAGISAKVSTSNGRFTGAFVHPVSGVSRKFTGVVFQKQNAGFGYFLGVDLSGTAAFAPAE